MRNAAKVLHFPFAGLSRSLSVRDNTQPSESRTYGTPLALNVRGTCVFADRQRGGSRGAFAAPVISSDPPEAYYHARRFYADGALWYASRTGNYADYDMGGDGEDVTRPVMGSAKNPSFPADEPITAIFAPTNHAVFMATANSLWIMRGEPTSGQFILRSATVGCVSRDAWAWDGTRYYVLSANGLYSFTPDEPPVRISDQIPVDLRGMSAAAMHYDPVDEVLHVVTDTKGSWTYEIANRAWWPFDDSGKSYVAIGPFRTSGRDDEDGIIDTLHVVLAAESASVSLEIYPARTAEAALEKARGASAAFTATVGPGFNHTLRPRVRGAWCVIVLRGTSPWAYETMTANCKQLGRLR